MTIKTWRELTLLCDYIDKDGMHFSRYNVFNEKCHAVLSMDKFNHYQKNSINCIGIGFMGFIAYFDNNEQQLVENIFSFDLWDYEIWEK